MKFIKKILPKSLAGQLIALILAALFSGHLIAFGIMVDERREALQAASRGEVLARTTTITRLLSVAPENLHNQILNNAQTPFIQFSLSKQSATDHPPQQPREMRVAKRLALMLEDPDRRIDVRLGFRPLYFNWDKDHLNSDQNDSDDSDDSDDDDDDRKHHNRFFDHRDGGTSWRQHFRSGIQLSVQLTKSSWLNAATQRPTRRATWAYQSILALVIAIIAIIGAVIFSVRRITRPLATLASAADAIGRGETISDLDEVGPQDLRRTINAFNRMRSRLENFIEDRTNLLAAVSHDLRSPVTSLRLRAEFIEDDELRGKILETLSEMQTIIETTLIFAREETRSEATRPTDLSALIESVVSDFRDLDKPCIYSGPDRLVIEGRPVSLKRAIRNLIENAITYGGATEVTLTPGMTEPDTDHTIVIEDNGPGIPEADIDRMFEPFVRLEASRSKETGGIGLGLAITRSIIRGHGGNIIAQNKPEGGLKVIISLPQAAMD